MCYNSTASAFEVNYTDIKGGWQSRRKVVPQDSKSDLPLVVLRSTLLQSWKENIPVKQPLVAQLMYQALLCPAGVRAGPLPGFGEKS